MVQLALSEAPAPRFSVMIKRNPIYSLSVSILLLVLSACSWWPMSRTAGLVGNWTNPIGTVWMIKADGTFDVQIAKNGQRSAWGKYSVNGNKFTVAVTGGVRPKDCDQEGIYKFRRNGDELHFTVISDPCKLRRTNLLLPWRLKG
jgi:hypothetical protein